MKLKLLRVSNNMSLFELAKLMEPVSYVTIHRWETYKSKPQRKNMKKLEEIFGVNFNDRDFKNERKPRAR